MTRVLFRAMAGMSAGRHHGDWVARRAMTAEPPRQVGVVCHATPGPRGGCRRRSYALALCWMTSRDAPGVRARDGEMPDGRSTTEIPAPPATMVRPDRLVGAPCHPPTDRRPPRTLEAAARQVGDDAAHDGRPQDRQEAQRDPGLLRGRSQPRHHGDERLGGARAGLVAEPAGPT